jgi:hypothetical protein
MAVVYDLPVQLQKAHWNDFMPAYLDTVPGKVLMAFCNDIILSTGEDLPKEPTFSLTQVHKPSIPPSYETNMSLDKDIPVVAQVTTVSGIAIKASKADDTKVDTWMWDKKMVKDFPQLNEWSVGSEQGNEALSDGLV